MGFDNTIDQNSMMTANDNAPVTDYNHPSDTQSLFQPSHRQTSQGFSETFRNKTNKFSNRVHPPASQSATYEAVPYTSSARDFSNVTSKTKTSVKSEKRDESIALALTLWVISISATLWTFLFNLAGNQQLLASITLIWTGLWVGYLGQDRQKPRLGDFGTFTAILGFISALAAAALKMNIPLSLADCIAVLTCVCLICSLLTESRIALILSACASLVGVYLHFLGEIAPYAMIVFPAIWSTQLYQASKLRSFLATLGIILVGYYWIFGFTLHFLGTGDLAPKFASTLIFLFGTLQYRIGKAAEDEHAPYAMVHMLMGWGVACFGAIITQAIWYYPGLDLWNLQSLQNTLPQIQLGNIVWIGLGMAMLTGIFFANLARWKNGRLALSSGIAIVLLCALFAFTSIFEDNMTTLLQSITPQLTSLHIGFAIGAGVLSSAIAMTVNGIRLNKITMTIAALIVIGLQIVLLADSRLFALEDGVIFVMFLTFALCFTAALSGKAIKQNLFKEEREAPNQTVKS